jgi:hypothetical protein
VNIAYTVLRGYNLTAHSNYNYMMLFKIFQASYAFLFLVALFVVFSLFSEFKDEPYVNRYLQSSKIYLLIIVGFGLCLILFDLSLEQATGICENYGPDSLSFKVPYTLENLFLLSITALVASILIGRYLRNIDNVYSKEQESTLDAPQPIKYAWRSLIRQKKQWVYLKNSISAY